MIKRIKRYLMSSYELVDSKTYYLKLATTMGLALIVFVFCFDPFEDYTHASQQDLFIRLFQVGYGLILSIIMYISYRMICKRLEKGKTNRSWKTYNHVLFLIIIYVLSAIVGTLYNRLFIEVRDLNLQYTFFIAIPRFLMMGVVFITTTILYDKLCEKDRQLASLRKMIHDVLQAPKNNSCKNPSPTLLKSPIVKQSVVIEPQNITYLKAYGNYVEIHLKNQRKAQLLRSPLHFVADQLTSFSYIRKCHRQYYININEIEFYRRHSERIVLRIKNSINNIPVSKKYTKEILSLIKNKQLISSIKEA